MPTPEEMPEEIKDRDALEDAFLAGEKILGAKFRHNSLVAFDDRDGIHREGWIVSLGPLEPEPVYTVERSDGGGDEEVPEPHIKLIHDPHEAPKA